VELGGVTITAPSRRNHPAPYPRYMLDALARYLSAYRRTVGHRLRILDPMAGIGRVHDLPNWLGETVGVELEPEWATQRVGTIVGDATNLPADWSATFDAIVVSPVYGNRMSDHHEAKDSCAQCQGTGTLWDPEGCGDAPMFCSKCGSVACACGGLAGDLRAHVGHCDTCRGRQCPTCKGNGLSRRYTYRHALQRPLSERNAGQMQWGDAYRTLHREAWAEAFRVLVPGGVMLLNVKNHVRGGVEQYVTEWHAETLRTVGLRVLQIAPITAPGLRHGENSSLRCKFEHVIVARKPKQEATP
jgi:hypothetical protein